MEKQSLRYFPIILFASVMGFAAFTLATIQMYEARNYLLYKLLYVFLMIFLTALVVYLSWYTINAWLKGRLAVAHS